MAKRDALEGEVSDGLILETNLIRLGYGRVDISGVAEKTGVSRQRMSTILNARRVTPEMIAKIAEGLGVTVKELMKAPRSK